MSTTFGVIGLIAGGILIGIGIGKSMAEKPVKEEGLNVLVYEHDGVDYIMAESNGNVTILKHTK